MGMEITCADEAFARLNEGLEWFATNHASLFCDTESIKAIERHQARFESVTSRAVAEFDQWGQFALDGAKTAVAWIDTVCHLPKKEARAQLRRGKALSELPLFAAAFAAGDIGAAQMDALIGVKRPVSEEALARDEASLVDFARTMKFAHFSHALDFWEQLADQDGTEAAAMARKERRDAYLVPSTGGYLGRMNFDLIDGAIVSNELRRIEKELFEADCAEAKERLGRDPRPDELARIPAQRRADAMKEMAIGSASARASAGRRPEPLFTVVIDYPTLFGRISQLAQGPAVTPGSLLSWLDQASFERIVFSPGKRAECSVTSRFFTGATRRAIEVRDLECCHEFCDLPAEQCEMDHIVPWSQGGLTTQENGQVLCDHHNRARYERPPPDG
jgi:HNH endonuclease